MTTEFAVPRPLLDPAAPMLTWHLSHPAAARERLLVGRQAIFTSAGHLSGYEVLFRSSHHAPLHVTHWSAAAQDGASAHVLRATFGSVGASQVVGDRQAFIKVTRPYLVGDLPLPNEPDRLVVEVVPSVEADPEVIAGVVALRARGFRIALDSFVGHAHQRRLLPFADYVKIDARDLDVEGEPLLTLARSHGAHLVAECIESPIVELECQSLGFELLQGNGLAATRVLDLTALALLERRR